MTYLSLATINCFKCNHEITREVRTKKEIACPKCGEKETVFVTLERIPLTFKEVVINLKG